jgi:Flp pilus assembly protein TadG
MKRALTTNEAGISATEFALVLPWLVLLTLGMIDYGWYFFVELNASTAAREGARAATTYAGPCAPEASAAAQAAVTSRMAVIGYDGNTTTTVACSGPPATDPEFAVSVVVLFPQLTGYSFIPLPRSGGNVRATAQVTMRGVP